MRTLKSIWESYPIPEGAGEEQRRGTRDAFYAGATAMFSLQLEAAEPTDEEECLRNMDQMHAEVMAFADEVAARVEPVGNA